MHSHTSLSNSVDSTLCGGHEVQAWLIDWHLLLATVTISKIVPDSVRANEMPSETLEGLLGGGGRGKQDLLQVKLELQLACI